MTTFPAYDAALSTVAYYSLPQAGILRLSGPDRLAFIQRQSTNNINLLTPAVGQVTILTSPIGRILDLFFVYPDPAGADALLILPLPGRAESTARFLKSRIFFMDKVSLADLSAQFAHYLVEGPQTSTFFASLGISSLPSLDGVLHAPFGEHILTILGQRGVSGTGWRILAPQAAAAGLQSAFQSAGLPHLSPQEYETLRIESGLPAQHHELTDQYTPLEVGMAQYVAENKGCYTGQEVLARQVNYDRITRQLTGLRLSVLPPEGGQVLAENRPIGEITSTVLSPRFGPIALAVLKRPHFEPGLALQITAQSETALTCQLPFKHS